MAGFGGGDGDGEYSDLNTPMLPPTRTAMADGGGEDVLSPPPFKIRKLGASGMSSIDVQSDALAVSDDKIDECLDSDCILHDPMTADYATDIELTEQICEQGIANKTSPEEVEKDGSKSKSIVSQQQMENKTTLGEGEVEMDLGKSNSIISEQEIAKKTSLGEVEMDGSKSKSIVSQEQTENKTTLGEGEVEMDLGKSKSIISEQQIENLRVQLDEMLAIIKHRIKPSAPLSSRGKETEDEDMVKELAELQGSMSKFKSQLKPYWHKYPNEIVLTLSGEMEKREKSRKEFEKMDNKEKARKEMDFDVSDFEGYCKGMSDRVEHFEFTTQVSPMHFTHFTPRQIPPNHTTSENTVQIFSFKIAKIDLDLQWPLLEWPLKVYGIVAARDSVDRRRNLLFFRRRRNFQEITQENPFLCLTGPSRAILAGDYVNLEVQLKLKGPTDSEDSVLISKRCQYSRFSTVNGLYTFTFENRLCTTELSLQRLYRRSVQATFLRVGGFVKGNTSPFIHGGRVACSTSPHGGQDTASPTQVVLLDSRYCDGGKMPIGEDGYLDLSRHVISVELRKVSADSEELEETLKVVIEAYSESPPKVSMQADFKVKPQYCGISEHECVFEGSKVKITIAWSALLRTNKVIP